MCGIAAIFSYRPSGAPVDREELRAIRDAMSARGPDGAGEWFSDDGRIGFGHRRLSIIDLSERGAQPMQSVDGRLTITFNGEIYNYKALRKGLEQCGARFHSDADTEVVLNLYAEKGPALFADLRGMYAFALWDRQERRMLLARDPYGIKPLYLADDGLTLRAASQVKALLAGGKVSRAVSPAGCAGFHLFGSVPEPHTLYAGIRALPAGAYVYADENGLTEPVRYFSIARTFAEAETREAPEREEDRFAFAAEALRDSVAHHMVADVPVGAFLSAGVDSGALVGLVRDAGIEDVQTVTLAFEEYRGRHDDEAPLARKTAVLYGTRHTERTITREEFFRDLPGILAAMDQPSIDGVNTCLVSKIAAESGLKVALSGLGGDELFHGYNTFDDVPRWVRLAALPSRIPSAGAAFRRAYAALAGAGNPKRAGLLEFGGTYPGAYLLRRGLFMPWELPDLMGADEALAGLGALAPMCLLSEAMEPTPATAYGKVAALEAAVYMRNQLLRDTDWAGMAHSMELRVPLVDAVLLVTLAPMLVRHARVDRKRLLARSPSTPLPQDILSRRKTGFQVPIKEWIGSHPAYESWKAVPSLAAPQCPWTRRWAYTVLHSGFLSR